VTKSIGEQNYEQFAERYAAAAETKAHNAYYDRPAMLSLLPDVSGLRVLDAGCGPGIYAEWLVTHGAQVVAFDVTPAFVEITRARLGDRATVLRADLTQPLDFAEENSFDGVLCPLVLDYIEDWSGVFREFYRVLKFGGWLVFSCGHPLGEWLYLNRKLPGERNYFQIEQYQTYWTGFGEPRPLVTAFRRPLSAIINPLLGAGFRLDTLLEPVPTEPFKQAEPEDYERLLREPGFLCVRAVKP
jgi:SAM-dependent methyltransferase